MILFLWCYRDLRGGGSNYEHSSDRPERDSHRH